MKRSSVQCSVFGVQSSTFRRLAVVLAVVSSAFGIRHSAFGQGSLTPPGAPAPTFKTLEQIEPRTPITNAPFIISQPGSYYLTADLIGVANGTGIVIQVSNVTVDLNGFGLRGLETGTGDGTGVLVPTAVENVRLHNGLVRGWFTGVSAQKSSGARYERLHISRCINGLLGGSNSVVLACVAERNSGGGEVSVGPNSLVRDCLAVANFGGGIAVGEGGIVIGCTAQASPNGGINGGVGSMVLDCAVRSNGLAGILVGDRSTVSRCTVTQTTGGNGGIQAAGDCVLLDNHSSGNSVSGIRLTGGGNRVEGNHARDNAGYGIEVAAINQANVIIRNTAGNNTSGNYSNTGGNNDYAPIAASPAAATNPWSNISY